MSVQPYKIGFGAVRGGEWVIVAVDSGAHYALDVPGPNGEAPPADLLEAIRSWDVWSPRLDAVATGTWPASVVAADEITFRVPVVGDKLLCIGANYADHVTEMDVPRPPWPYAFIVPPTTTLVVSGTPVTIPLGVKWWDWEAELAVVVGQRLRHAPVEDCLAAVAGYLPLNDLSARDTAATKIAMGVDMVTMKAHDDSKVVGPLITPAQFVPDPQDLRVTCTLNGVEKQNMHTSTMVYTVAECLAHLSSIMTLVPGDIVATGTGGGVGILRNPIEVMAPGDVVVVAVEGVGQATTPMRADERELTAAG